MANRKKWKRRIPIDIDAITGSAFVQALHPTARSGYIWLLFRQWQTEECSLPNDQALLAANAGLTAEEWAIHGPEILKKFYVAENEELRNEVCYEAWINVGTAYEARRLAAEQTNSKRWGKSSDTETVTDSLTETVTDNTLEIHRSGKAVNPAAVGKEMWAATQLFEKLGIPADFGTRDIAAQAIRLLAVSDPTDAGITNASERLFEIALADQKAGEIVNRFYFSDQKYLHKNNGKKAALDAQARVGTWDGLSSIDHAKKRQAEGKPLTHTELELLKEEQSNVGLLGDSVAAAGHH